MTRVVKIKDRITTALQFRAVFEQQIIFFCSGDYIVLSIVLGTMMM